MTAYVAIRQDPRDIRVICRPCDGDATFPTYRAALAGARLHNQTEHPKEHQ